MSPSSAETVIDFPPEKPGKPVVKRLSMRSLHVSSVCPPGAGTFPSKFKVTMVTSPKITNANPVVLAESKVESTDIVPATIHISGKREVHYTVNDVDPLLSYTFSVVAINSTGFSESSDWSDDVDIGELFSINGNCKLYVPYSHSFILTFRLLGSCLDRVEGVCCFCILLYNRRPFLKRNQESTHCWI